MELWGTDLISTVGIHFTTTICGINVDVALVEDTSDKDVRGRLEELDTGDGAGGDGAGTMTWFGAPSDGLGFLVTN